MNNNNNSHFPMAGAMGGMGGAMNGGSGNHRSSNNNNNNNSMAMLNNPAAFNTMMMFAPGNGGGMPSAGSKLGTNNSNTENTSNNSSNNNNASAMATQYMNLWQQSQQQQQGQNYFNNSDAMTVDSWGAGTHWTAATGATGAALALIPAGTDPKTGKTVYICPKHPTGKRFDKSSQLCTVCEDEFQQKRRELQERRATVDQMLDQQSVVTGDGNQSLGPAAAWAAFTAGGVAASSNNNGTSNTNTNPMMMMRPPSTVHVQQSVSNNTQNASGSRKLPPRAPVPAMNGHMMMMNGGGGGDMPGSVGASATGAGMVMGNHPPHAYMGVAGHGPASLSPPFGGGGGGMMMPTGLGGGVPGNNNSSMDAVLVQMQRMNQMQDWFLWQKEQECAQLRQKLDQAGEQIQQLRVENTVLTEKLHQQEQRMQHELKLIKMAAYQKIAKQQQAAMAAAQQQFQQQQQEQQAAVTSSALVPVVPASDGGMPMMTMPGSPGRSTSSNERDQRSAVLNSPNSHQQRQRKSQQSSELASTKTAASASSMAEAKSVFSDSPSAASSSMFSEQRDTFDPDPVVMRRGPQSWERGDNMMPQDSRYKGSSNNNTNSKKHHVGSFRNNPTIQSSSRAFPANEARSRVGYDDAQEHETHHDHGNFQPFDNDDDLVVGNNDNIDDLQQHPEMDDASDDDKNNNNNNSIGMDDDKPEGAEPWVAATEDTAVAPPTGSRSTPPVTRIRHPWKAKPWEAPSNGTTTAAATTSRAEHDNNIGNHVLEYDDEDDGHEEENEIVPPGDPANEQFGHVKHIDTSEDDGDGNSDNSNSELRGRDPFLEQSNESVDAVASQMSQQMRLQDSPSPMDHHYRRDDGQDSIASSELYHQHDDDEKKSATGDVDRNHPKNTVDMDHGASFEVGAVDTSAVVSESDEDDRIQGIDSTVDSNGAFAADMLDKAQNDRAADDEILPDGVPREFQVDSNVDEVPLTESVTESSFVPRGHTLAKKGTTPSFSYSAADLKASKKGSSSTEPLPSNNEPRPGTSNDGIKKKKKSANARRAVFADAADGDVSTTFGEDREQVTNRIVYDPYGDRGVYTGVILRSTGMPHGNGRMIYQEDHRTYDGEWRHGRWHGFGRATFANGDNYVGEYRFDQRHGRGCYTWADGRIFDGIFHEDKRHGKGRFTWPDGADYEGGFVNGQREGHGIYKFSDGGRYEGGWKDGRYNGFGICQWQDGRTYKGEWMNGMAHGKGVETFANGTVRHDGLWIEDEPVLS